MSDAKIIEITDHRAAELEFIPDSRKVSSDTILSLKEAFL